MKPGRKPIGKRTMTTAERQARYRAGVEQKQRAHEAFVRRHLRRSRRQRWEEAVAELEWIQRDYIAWLRKLSPALQNSPTAELLRKIQALDLDPLLEIDLPRGFGHFSST